MSIDGKPAFTGILHDLSKRKEIETALRKSEERLRSIVESAVDGVIVIDERGRIQAFNRSAERLFGYKLEEVIGRNVNVLMPSPDREQHDGYLNRYLTTGAPEHHRYRTRGERPPEGRDDVSRCTCRLAR